MTIYGVSQSSGVERRLKVERGGQGLVLTILDHPENKERIRILVQADDLLATITDSPPGGMTIQGEGIVPHEGVRFELNVDVRRNEIWMKVSGAAEESDIAVGLDDFQDALEGVITRG